MRLISARYGLMAAMFVVSFAALNLCFIGCDSGGRAKFGGNAAAADPANIGETVDGDVPLVCSQCLADEKVGQTVAVEGEIVQQCPASGCWFRMKDDVGEVFVDLAPAKLRLLEKREGQHVKVTGRVVKVGGQFRLDAQYVEFLPTKKNEQPGSK